VAELKGLVQQQDALNAGLQQRVQTAGEAEARAKVSHHSLLLSHHTQRAALNCHLSHCHKAKSDARDCPFLSGVLHAVQAVLTCKRKYCSWGLLRVCAMATRCQPAWHLAQQT